MSRIPEEVLVATLNRVGPELRVVNDQRLVDILTGAGGVYSGFLKHPNYGYCKTLDEAITNLVCGGAVLAFLNMDGYRAARAAGPWGAAVYESFSPEERAEIDAVAAKIKLLPTGV